MANKRVRIVDRVLRNDWGFQKDEHYEALTHNPLTGEPLILAAGQLCVQSISDPTKLVTVYRHEYEFEGE